MWPFNRKKNVEQPAIPDEIKDYYASEHRGRQGMAWLLALGTLLATLILAAGLFFGGRWVYRKIRGGSTEQPTPPVAQNENPAPAPSSPATPSKKPATKHRTASPKVTKRSVASKSRGGSRPTSTALVNTGPGNIIGVFIVATVLGTAGHYFTVKTKENRA